MHRDLKTSNLLYNNQGELKLCDFGESRKIAINNRNKYTKGRVTLWYRSPELILGEGKYNESIDIWSAGCIFAEFITRK